MPSVAQSNISRGAEDKRKRERGKGKKGEKMRRRAHVIQPILKKIYLTSKKRKVKGKRERVEKK